MLFDDRSVAVLFIALCVATVLSQIPSVAPRIFSIFAKLVLVLRLLFVVAAKFLRGTFGGVFIAGFFRPSQIPPVAADLFVVLTNFFPVTAALFRILPKLFAVRFQFLFVRIVKSRTSYKKSDFSPG